MDAESGIETDYCDSAAASVTSSECANHTSTSVRRDSNISGHVDTALMSNMTSLSDDVGEFIKMMMVQPPPSPVYLDDCDVAVVPPPTDMLERSRDVPPPATDYSPYRTLPPLVELPEDDVMTPVSTPPPPPPPSNYDRDPPDRLPRTAAAPRPSTLTSVDEFPEPKTRILPLPRNIVVNSVDSLSTNATAAHNQRSLDENSNFVSAIDRCNRLPLPATRYSKTTMANNVDHVVDVAVAVSQTQTPTENTKSMTLPVSATDKTSAARQRFHSVPLPTHRRFFGATKTYTTNSHKKPPTGNIWKRFLKRDVDSGGMTSSTGFTWSLFAHRQSATPQSQSVAESTATYRRRPKNPQSRVAALAAAKARDMHISEPFNFRDLSNASQKPAQGAASEQLQPNSTDNREVSHDGIRSAGRECRKLEDNVSSGRGDGVAPAKNASSSSSSLSTGFSWSLFHHRKSATLQPTTALQQRSNKLPSISTQSKIAALAAGKARHMHISAPFDFRELKTDVIQKITTQRAKSDAERVNSTNGSEFERGGMQLTTRKDIDQDVVSSASDDDFREDESLETRSTTSYYYRDEQGRLRSVATDPAIYRTTSVDCLSSTNDDKRFSAKSMLSTTTDGMPTPGQPRHHSPPSSRRISLMRIGATLPRLYKRSQSVNEDQLLASQHSSDLPLPETECHDDDLSEVTRIEYLQTPVTGPDRQSPAADTCRLLRRSLTEEPTSSPPLLNLLDSIITLEDENDDVRTPGTIASGAFDTFRGALKPVRWSEERRNTKKQRSLSVDSTASNFGRQLPAYIDVRPPPKFFSGVPSAPVAAPRSVTTRDTQRPERPQKPSKPVLSADSRVSTTRDDISSSELTTGDKAPPICDRTMNSVTHTLAQEVQDYNTEQSRISSCSADSDDVFVAPAAADTATDADDDLSRDSNDDDDATPLGTPDESLTIICQQAYDFMQSVIDKTYSMCACDEATCDIDAMMTALERLRSAYDVDVPTTSTDATNDLPTTVRQLVTDSRNLVAGGMSSSTNREVRLRGLTENTMHTLAVVFRDCCRLLACFTSPGVVADVVDHVMTATSSLRTTVEAVVAVSAALDAGADSSEADRCKDALLATAALLAKSLSDLVQKVKAL